MSVDSIPSGLPVVQKLINETLAKIHANMQKAAGVVMTRKFKKGDVVRIKDADDVYEDYRGWIVTISKVDGEKVYFHWLGGESSGPSYHFTPVDPPVGKCDEGPANNHGQQVCQFGCGCETETRELFTSVTNVCPKCGK